MCSNFHRKSYIQKHLLGSGTYAKVYLAVDSELNICVALKKIRLDYSEGVPSTALREISALKSLKHPNVIKLLNVMQTDQFLTMVFEYMEYDLKKYSEKYGFSHFLFSQLVAGVDYIHSRKIIHRDLKPQNILVTKSGILKIADFGLCRPMHLPVPDLSHEVVTLWYRAPELLQNKDYSYEIDIFSIGPIVYEMVTGKILLQGNDNPSQLQLIFQILGNTSIRRDTLAFINDHIFREVVQGCCQISRMDRWTIEDLKSLSDQNVLGQNYYYQ